MLEPFEHEPLQKGCIRLLEACHRNDSSSLEFNLIPLSLDEARKVGYEALSYTWGDDSLLHPIKIHQRTFHVRQNLYDFLQITRKVHLRSLLWIDAVSIDQGNVEERNSQVRMMTKIYQSANAVIAWLGAGDLGFRCFHRDNALDSNGLEISLHAGQNLDFLLNLAASEYWQRAWIVQELASARRICFRSRSEMLDMKDLWSRLLDTDAFNDWLFRTAPSDVRFQIRPMLNVLRRADRSYPQLQPFESIVHDFSNLKCSEPRDHIYAFSALFEGKVRRKLPIDYGVSIPELISKALECCETKTNLHSLSTILRAWKIDKDERQRDKDRVIFARLCPKMDDRFVPCKPKNNNDTVEARDAVTDLGPSGGGDLCRTLMAPELQLSCTRTHSDATEPSKLIFLPCAAAERMQTLPSESWCLALLDVQYDLYFTKPFNLRNSPSSLNPLNRPTYAGLAVIVYTKRNDPHRVLDGEPEIGVWLTEAPSPAESDGEQSRYEQECRDMKSLRDLVEASFRNEKAATWRYRSRSEINLGLPLLAWMEMYAAIQAMAARTTG